MEMEMKDLQKKCRHATHLREVSLFLFKYCALISEVLHNACSVVTAVVVAIWDLAHQSAKPGSLCCLLDSDTALLYLND